MKPHQKNWSCYTFDDGTHFSHKFWLGIWSVCQIKTAAFHHQSRQSQFAAAVISVEGLPSRLFIILTNLLLARALRTRNVKQWMEIVEIGLWMYLHRLAAMWTIRESVLHFYSVVCRLKAFTLARVPLKNMTWHGAWHDTLHIGPIPILA